MFPERLPSDVTSNAERRLFDLFRDEFSNDFVVFAGIKWLASSRGKAKDGEADFIVAHPSYGVLVIEVKGGGISCENGKYFSTDSSGRKHEIKDPFAQAKHNKDVLWDKLRDADSTRGFRWKLGHAVALPDITVNNNLALDAPLDIVIDSERTRGLKQAIIDIFEHYGLDETPMGDAAVEVLCGLLCRSWQISTSIGTELDGHEHIIRTLTEEQFHLLDNLASHPRLLISGCAGSGKTMLAIEKARRLATEGYSVLLTCFNKNLEAWLKSQLDGQANITVHRFLSLCAVLCEKAGKPITKGDDESEKDFFDRFPDALLDVLADVPDRFDAIIVDEAQDFSEGQWAALTSLLHDPDGGILYIFFDDNQRLYRREIAFPITSPPVHLSRNCRNTQQIHEAARLFYDSNVAPACIGPEGRKPHSLEVPKGANERMCVEAHITHLIEKEAVLPGQIALLTRRSRERSDWKDPPSRPSWSATWDFADCADKVICSTIHAFKGLERPVVIVCELQDVDIEGEGYLLYVAFSRAREHLVVVGADKLSG